MIYILPIITSLIIHFAKTANTSILYKNKMAKAAKDLLKMKLVFHMISKLLVILKKNGEKYEGIPLSRIKN